MFLIKTVFGSVVFWSIIVASSYLPFWTGPPVDRGWLWPNIWSAGFYFDPTPYLGLGLGADESKSRRINRISIQAAIFIIVRWDSGFSVMIALLFEEMVGGRGETHWELQRSNWQEQISWELFPHKKGRRKNFTLLHFWELVCSFIWMYNKCVLWC